MAQDGEQHAGSSQQQGSLGFLSTWSMTVGGMVGGGIYTALGVVVAVSAQWAWLAFLLAGCIALTTAFCYVYLATTYEESGGAFRFLREINREGFAGNLSWLLIMGYVLTMALYAFAFGHYLSFAFGGGAWLTRLLALGIVAGLVLINLGGVGKTATVEIVIVWGNLLVLLGLVCLGFSSWNEVQLVAGLEPRPVSSALVGAAAIFVSYEGFQLLTYEYNEIRKPKKNLLPAVLSGVGFVVLIYILVALSATVLAGALTTVEERQIALSVAALEAIGPWGLVAMTVAAGFATAAAINSTLFSTGKLVERIASDGELPKFFKHTNEQGIPDRAVIFLGVFSGILAISGSLSTLVETASVIFLATFGSVNLLAYRQMETYRWVPLAGIGLIVSVGAVLLLRLALHAPVPLGILLTFCLLVILGRPWLLSLTETT